MTVVASLPAHGIAVMATPRHSITSDPTRRGGSEIPATQSVLSSGR